MNIICNSGCSGNVKQLLLKLKRIKEKQRKLFDTTGTNTN